jgi:hypothetical protein
LTKAWNACASGGLGNRLERHLVVHC